MAHLMQVSLELCRARRTSSNILSLRWGAASPCRARAAAPVLLFRHQCRCLPPIAACIGHLQLNLAALHCLAHRHAVLQLAANDWCFAVPSHFPAIFCLSYAHLGLESWAGAACPQPVHSQRCPCTRGNGVGCFRQYLPANLCHFSHLTAPSRNLGMQSRVHLFGGIKQLHAAGHPHLVRTYGHHRFVFTCR